MVEIFARLDLDGKCNFSLSHCLIPERKWRHYGIGQLLSLFIGLFVMIIDLKSITGVARHFDFVLESDWWQDDDDSGQVLGLDGALTCHIDIVRAGIKYIFDGDLSGALFSRCDRCLETFRRELDLKFRLFLSSNYPDEVEGEVELSEDDLSMQFVTGDEVELNDIVREQIYLSLPMKSLCSADCSGLCPICGTNLNKVECQCRRGEGHRGFGKLRALILNGEQ